jgi:hypothetical protein
VPSTAAQIHASEITNHVSELWSFYSDDLEPMIVDQCFDLKPILVQNIEEKKCMTLTDVSKVFCHFDAVDM